VWDLASTAPVGEFKGHLDDSTTLAFSPDGRHPASGSTDHSVRIWDMRGVRVVPADPVVVSGQTLHVRDVNADLGRVVTSMAEGGALLWWNLDAPERFRTLGYTSAGAGPRATTPSASTTISLALTPGGLNAVAGHADGTGGAWLSVLSRDSSVGVFDTRSSYPFDADQLVSRLFAQTRLSSEVIDRLRRDPSLDRAVRHTAEQMARAQGTNGERLIAESRLIAEFLGRSPEEYRRALTDAQAAVDELPASVGAADALGLALYRVGRYRDAVAAFRRCRSLRGGLEFVGAVFTPMALGRLNDEAASQAAADELGVFFKGLANIYPTTPAEAEEPDVAHGVRNPARSFGLAQVAVLLENCLILHIVESRAPESPSPRTPRRLPGARGLRCRCWRSR
jgi:hypothetical protein